MSAGRRPQCLGALSLQGIFRFISTIVYRISLRNLTNMTLIRLANIQDLPSMLEIYNDEIKHGTATFDTKPLSLQERLAWFNDHNKNNHPLIVAEINGEVLGYASLSTFNAKSAYDSSTELSVYVHKKVRGQGIGRLLMQHILQMAADDPVTHRVYSLITADNTASIALHQKFGFRLVGTITEAGTKFGRWLDVTYWEKAV